MRIKLILSLLSLGSVILLSSYLYLSVSARRALNASEFARFSNTILKSLAHPHEGGAFRALRLSAKALSSTPAKASIDVDGRNYTFPLPKYAIHQEQNARRFHFLVFASPEEVQNYFSRDLPRAG